MQLVQVHLVVDEKVYNKQSLVHSHYKTEHYYKRNYYNKDLVKHNKPLLKHNNNKWD
jgi:hypothetical protein